MVSTCSYSYQGRFGCFGEGTKNTGRKSRIKYSGTQHHVSEGLLPAYIVMYMAFYMFNPTIFPTDKNFEQKVTDKLTCNVYV
jgi:hypothetical protein